MSVWDDLEREAYSRQGGQSTGSIWDQIESGTITPPKPESRGLFGAVNDYVIEAANAVLGGGKAVIDFAAPGTELANQIEALIQQGVESQSQVAQQAKQRLGEDIEAGGMQALKGVGSYVLENPALALSQAVGSFAIPAGAIKGAQLGARALGATERAAARATNVGPITPAARAAAMQRAESRVGTGAGMGVGAVLGAGEAGGDAYEQVYQGLIDQGVDPEEADRQATQAARLAMPAPALVGAIAGRFGAERAVATGTRGGSILRMAGSEAAQEFAEEGTTKLSANIAAGQYVDGIDPMKGVLGSAALGAALGGMTGAAIGTITPRDKQPGTLLGGANDALQGSRTPGGDAIRQAINTGPTLPEVITVSPRGEAFVSPEQQEAYNRFGQMGGRPDVSIRPAAPATAPATAAAPAATQQTTRAQQAKAQPVTQDEYVATAQAYGVTPVQGLANTWDIGGARVYGQPNIRTVVEGLAENDRQSTPIQREITGALLATGLAKIPANVANAKPVINAINKAVQKYGLTDVATVEEAVARVNDQISTLASQGKPATNTLVEQLDQLHNALTGQSSPLYTQLLEGAQNEQQAATRVGAVSEQAGAGQAVGGVGRTDAGPVQSLLAGSVAGQPPSVQNVPTGVGGARGGAAVAPAGVAVGDGRPVSGQVADQGEKIDGIQPTTGTGAGSQAGVGRTFRVTRPRTEGAGPGAAAPTGGVEPTVESDAERAGETEEVAIARRAYDGIADRFGVDSRFDNLTPSLQDIWFKAVEANKANIEVVRAIDAENQIESTSLSAQNILDAAVAKLFPLEKQQNKARFVAEMLGTPQTARLETVKKLAERFGVSEDTIKKDWNRTVKALFGEDRPKLENAINAVLSDRGLNQEQVSELFADLQESIGLADTTQTLTAVPEGETKVDERDLADPESATREADRKSLSVQEFGNEAENLSARYVRLSEEIDTVEQELDAARAEGNDEILPGLEARLGELTESLTETEEAIVKNADRQAKSVRRTAGRVKQEKEDAVQEQGAAEVPVQPRARGGEEVGQKVRGAKKPAAEGKPAEKPKGEVAVVKKAKPAQAPKLAPKQEAKPAAELTKAEEVEAKYNELRGFAPDVLPTWDMLTEEQRNQLLAIDRPADINFKNLEQLVDQTNVIEGEARVIPDAERTLLLEQTSKLNDSQTKLLESHYGDKAGTDAFLTKLSQDITTYVNRGAEFVAAKIRGVIQQLAKAAIAAAIVFNPNITGNGFNFNLQDAYASIQAQQVEVTVPAEVAAQMSEEAKIIYRQVAPLAKQEQRGFMIADKRNGKLHMFFASGQHLASDTALYGQDIGDTLEGNSLKGGKKITPTGKFTLVPVADSDYEGGWRLDLKETSDDGTVIAVHPAYLGDVNERRLERLASPDVKDNRISYGCINTSHETFINKINPQLGEFNGGFIYVLPEAPFAPTQTAKVQFSKKRRREKGSDVKDVKKVMAGFLGAENERAVAVVQGIEDIPADVRKEVERLSGGPITDSTQGFVYKRRAYLIADNIEPGTERAVIMHEVGSHLGLENILSEAQFDTLVDQILEWADKQNDSIESVVATKALVRVISANPSMETRNSELLAYFIEEAILAGVNPTATSTQAGFGSWFRTLWAAFKSAVRKLGINPDKMDALDIVNMAYGAARLEVAGTWHGTASNFRKFSHEFMGGGEGFQAYGWGTYVAQRAGIAYEYMTQDAARKTTGGNFRMADRRPIIESTLVFALFDAQKAGVDFSDAAAVQKTLKEIEKDLKKRLDLALKAGAAAYAGKQLQSSLTELQEAIKVGGVTYEPVKKPEGRLLRVDINAKQDELLDWAIPIQDQRSVVKKLKADSRFQAFLERLDAYESIGEFSGYMFDSSASVLLADGETFYRGMTELISGGKLTPKDLGIKVPEDTGSDQILSKYLDSVGIPGLKFFDARSRDKSKSFYKQQIANLKLMAEAAKESEEAFGIKSVLTPEKFRIRLEDLNEKLASAREDYELTQNLVIFNDKNVIRVASLPGAQAERVQFSKTAQANINRLPKSAQPQATQIHYTLKDWAAKVAPTFAFTQDLVDMAKKLMPSAKSFIRLYNEKQVTQTEYELQVKKIVDDFEALPQQYKGIGAGSVNEFIKDSTMSGKWGYKIKPDSDVEPDPMLEARFNAFPKEAQQVIKDVFNHGYQTLQDMKNAIRANINTEYDALIEDAKQAGNDKEVADLQAAKDGLLRDYQKLFAIKGSKPYAPLKRFGDYVVIGKSQRLLDLEEMLGSVRGADRAAINKQITELQRQPEHYYVGFAETAGDGQVIAQSISSQYDFVSEPFERSAEESLYGGSDLNQVFARLRNLSEEALKSSDKDMVARGVRKTIVDMQTMMLSQQSVMHATNRRLGIAGADADMMRAFATQGRASAHFIGSLTNTSKIYESLRTMRKESGYNPEARRYFNEFVRRHAMGYDYEPSPLLDKAMATTSLWMLLTSPAYYLQNMTQPFMMSVPFMAGKHGEGRSLKSLFAAYPETFALLKDISIKRPGQQVDFDSLPADVRDAVKELVKRGRIQITLDRDLGEFTSAEDGVFRKIGKTSEYLRGIAEKAELINRVATAIAAYRLEIANGADSSKALNYADKVIRITHGDYSGANAPRVMRKGVGRLVTQFRKFQLIQISMMVRLLNDATKGETAKDRAMARKALVWTLTHAGVAGGIMGLPGFAAAAALYGMLFADDDEPFNAELELRNYFGDELGTLMTKGLPAHFGVDLSGKIGMGQMLSILPYTDFDLSRAGWQETVTAGMGPFIGGLVPRAIDGARFISEGNYYRGVENFMPKGVSDTLKAYRLANEGVTQRNNDVLLSADELGFADILFQGLGLPTTKLTEQQFRTGVKIETEEFFSKLTTELKRDYSKAYQENDRVTMEAVRQRWKQVQDRRAALGIKKQPLSELLRSPREQRKRERDTVGGVQYSTSTRRFAEALPQ